MKNVKLSNGSEGVEIDAKVAKVEGHSDCTFCGSSLGHVRVLDTDFGVFCDKWCAEALLEHNETRRDE